MNMNLKSEPQNQENENRRTAECRMMNFEGRNSIVYIINSATTLCLWGDEDHEQLHQSAFRVMN